MVDQIELGSLKTNDRIEHFLLITSLSLKKAKTGKEYLDLELRDKSLLINAKMWDNFEPFLASAKVGSIVKVRGVMDEFNNQPQIKIEKIRLANKNDNVHHADLLPKSNRPIDEMKAELAERIEKIKNEHLNKLIKSIFTRDVFNKYINVPAGKAWHHAYIGGLIEHTLEIIRICDLMCDFHSEINRDLLVTGAILHDLGKIEELEYETGFGYTDKGQLLGHIVIAANIVEEKARSTKEFPEELKNNLIHLILSHQGKLEFASPVVPKTLEAIVLYHADELSAKTNAYKLAILAEMDSETGWTKYLRLAETSLYIPRYTEDKDNFNETLF